MMPSPQGKYTSISLAPLQSFSTSTAHPFSTWHSYEVAKLNTFLSNGFKSFNPLFKVLFTFPSQYLFAIGFPSIFSLRWSISPIRAEIPSNPTLWACHYDRSIDKNGAFTLFGGAFSTHFLDRSATWLTLETTIPNITIWIFGLDFTVFSRPYLPYLS